MLPFCTVLSPGAFRQQQAQRLAAIPAARPQRAVVSTPFLRERLPGTLSQVWASISANSELISVGFEKCGILMALDEAAQVGWVLQGG